MSAGQSNRVQRKFAAKLWKFATTLMIIMGVKFKFSTISLSDSKLPFHAWLSKGVENVGSLSQCFLPINLQLVLLLNVMYWTNH